MKLLTPVMDFLEKAASALGKPMTPEQTAAVSSAVGGTAAAARIPGYTQPTTTRGGVPLSSATQVIESRSISETRGTVDMNITGAPPGTTVKTSGAAAPKVTLSTGPLTGRGR